MDDMFGIKRETEIVKSNIRNIFTPHTPIHSVKLFFGRKREVSSLLEHLNTPGQHAILFGDRGVGKSSLANIASYIVLEQISHGKFYSKRCDSTDTFSTIVAEPLMDLGVDIGEIDSQKIKIEGGKTGVNIPCFTAGVHTTSQRTINEQGASVDAQSPGWVAKKLAHTPGLLLVDELDALKNPSDRHKIAELIKQLSDAASPFKVLLVGIAETGADLTEGHPSVDRCLRETRLGRMSYLELKEILDEGERKANLRFSAHAKSKIINVSAGYPHFTHLLALKSAEDAVAEGRVDIQISHVEAATRRAVDDSEGRLKRVYEEAVRSAATDEYRRIVYAASLIGSDEFRASDLRKKYQDTWKRPILQTSLNNYFSRLVSDKNETVLRRIAKGVYRFNDPRMPSFVRIANLSEERRTEEV